MVVEESEKVVETAVAVSAAVAVESAISWEKVVAVVSSSAKATVSHVEKQEVEVNTPVAHPSRHVHTTANSGTVGEQETEA